MTINTITHSFCPVCYKVLPADIRISDNVVIHKTCPDHGESSGVIDTDPVWWSYAMSLGYRDAYEGYMIDVTNMCNIKCKYCYHHNTPTHRPIPDIMNELSQVKTNIIILSGGEPTLHPQITTIMDMLHGKEVFVLTNGTKINTQDTFLDFISHGLIYGRMLSLGLSIHLESHGMDIEVLELCRKFGYKLWTVFFVIDDLSQIPHILTLIDTYSDVIEESRIKAASNLWNETSASPNRIFVSDMVKFMESVDGHIDTRYNIMPYYAPMLWKGNKLRMIRWHDKYNIDLDHLANSHPLYRAQDGTVNCISVSCIINEGIERVYSI
jgi:hypothetical protein